MKGKSEVTRRVLGTSRKLIVLVITALTQPTASQY